MPHLVCRFWFKLVGVYLQDEGTVIKKYLAAAFSLVQTLKELKGSGGGRVDGSPLPEKPVRSMALRLVALMTVAVSLPAVGR